MKLRDALTGMAVACQWICNAAVAFIFPPMLCAIGNQTFYVFAAINVLSLVYVIFCLPETKDKSLEEIETMMRERYSEK